MRLENRGIGLISDPDAGPEEIFQQMKDIMADDSPILAEARLAGK